MQTAKLDLLSRTDSLVVLGNEDGTASIWEFENSYMVRKNCTAPSFRLAVKVARRTEGFAASTVSRAYKLAKFEVAR